MAPASASSVKQLLFPLEVAIFDSGSAVSAVSHGVKRIEINAPGSYVDGGTTPPLAMLRSVKAQVEVPIRVMIRPRGAQPDAPNEEFIYTEQELTKMQADISEFINLNVMNPINGDGFVFGVLRLTKLHEMTSPDDRFRVDEEACARLIKAAKGYPCVFHRAFDFIADTDRCAEEVRTIKKCGFAGLLTSGGRGDCASFISNLQTMSVTVPSNFQLIVGGGIRGYNANGIATALRPDEKPPPLWLHTAAMARTESGDIVSQSIDTAKLRDIVNALCDAKGN